jgi:nitrogen fixation/metabolism regulation signal transduction histidine kinase
VELVFFLNRTIRELTQFLDHIRNKDFNVRFNEQESKGSRKELHKTFNEVLQVYSDIRIEKEVHFRFLEHIIELIEIGIIVFDRDGNVVLTNTAAGNFSGVPSLRSWKQLVKRNPALSEAIGSLESSKQVLFESLAIQVSKTRMLEESYTLVSLQDVKDVVEQKETGAWNKLLRTLNHEIKNSVTPISSLADTLVMILQDERGRYKPIKDLDQQNLTDIITSAETLQQRSRSLHAFIDEYHKLTRIPVPDPQIFSCNSILEDIRSLFRSECESKGIYLRLNLSAKNLEIRADRGMIEQVLINLVRNSLEALTERPDPEILLSANKSGDKIIIELADNGAGIDQNILEDVFIPFFSTKSKGSGIGLSLVRQIMRLHGGDVQINSAPGKGTLVSLSFHMPLTEE